MLSPSNISGIHEEWKKRCWFQNPDGTDGKCDCFECRAVPPLIAHIEVLERKNFDQECLLNAKDETIALEKDTNKSLEERLRKAGDNMKKAHEHLTDGIEKSTEHQPCFFASIRANELIAEALAELSPSDQ